MSRCLGCGVKLQMEDSKKPGYIPPSKESEGGAYCKRCYLIRHHNLDYSSENIDILKDKALLKKKHYEYIDLLKNIKNEECLVLLMLDALDIYTTFLKDLKKIVGNKDLWILVNKSDLYPKSFKINKIKENIEKLLTFADVKCRNIFFISCLKEKNVDVIMDRMFTSFNKKHHANNLVYVIGATSVGKSSFINMVLKKYAQTVDLITTSNVANTTMNLIKIGVGKNRFKEECYLIDTPGFINERSIQTICDLDTLKVLVPKNFIRVKTYQLNSQQTLFLGGLVRIDVDTEKTNVSFYVSDKLYIHRTKTINADKVYDNLKYQILQPPKSLEEESRLGNIRETKIECNEHIRVWLSGIGFFEVNGKCNLSISAYEIIEVTLDE